MKRKHSSTAVMERNRMKVNKSVRFDDAKLLGEGVHAPSTTRVLPPALAVIPTEEKTNVWYSQDDVNQFKLSARILALRVRQSDRQRVMDEDEINSTTCERRRSSLQSVYNRNMDKASEDVQSSCLDMDTEQVRNLWDNTTSEVNDFETLGIVPRGLELQISFARQRRQKVGVLKLLEYQNKFKAAIADDSGSDNEGPRQNGIPEGYTLADVLSSALRQESRWSRDKAQITGRDDFAAAYEELFPVPRVNPTRLDGQLLSSSASPVLASTTAPQNNIPLETIDEDIPKHQIQPRQEAKNNKRHQRSRSLYDSAAIVSDDNEW